MIYNSNDVSGRTEVIFGTDNVLEKLFNFISTSKTIKCCGDIKSVILALKIKQYRDLLYNYNKNNVDVKCITEINQQNLKYCKKITKYAQLRHLEGIKANFTISESEYLASSFLNKMDLQHLFPLQKIIYSSMPDIVDHQRYIFETLWGKSIPAEQRIKELERGHEIGKTEVFHNPVKTKGLFIDLVQRSNEEVLLLLPTINAFLREHRLGIFEYLKDAAEKRGVYVKILTPTSDKITNLVKDLELYNKKYFIIYPFEAVNELKINTITMAVADKKESLVFEKIDDLKEDFEEAIGLTTYSTSKPTVISYVSIFESLVNQIKLNEKLKAHDKMQHDFINIASHELRTPIQAIIAYSDLIENHPEKKQEMIEALKRNATSLQRLAEDILMVSKIESGNLVLHKEKFDLDNLLTVFIEDYKKNILSSDKDIKKKSSMSIQIKNLT